jgi:hypothetical protein
VISSRRRIHCGKQRGRTVICRLGRVACPRSRFQPLNLELTIQPSKFVGLSGGKPPFLTCRLAGIEPTLGAC